jgi:predicted short-subunit dehydrogenase-like oxidoreductase (DUF2520 family)
MNIIFIGAGNLATNLSKALYRSGHDILQVYSRTADSADRMADLFECAATTNLDDVRTDADVYIFSVKDSVLADLAGKLAKRIPNKLFVHTAGSMSVDVLPVEHRAVLYPMQTFSKYREVDFNQISVFVEAAFEQDLNIVRTLARDISDRVYELSSDDRKYLHLSAVFCCNFANHCYALGEKILKEHDIPFNVMHSLIDETAKKVHEMSPVKAQTGPAIRWDENVINKQKELLEENKELKAVYEMMSRSIHALSEEDK